MLWFFGHKVYGIFSSPTRDQTHIPSLEGKVLNVGPPAAAAAKSLQSCPTLCDPIDGSPPGSPIPGILQARTLEWVAISSSNAWKWKVKVKSLSHVRLLATPWTQPTRLLHPWDFPGKSTGVGCHCLLLQRSPLIAICYLFGGCFCRLFLFLSFSFLLFPCDLMTGFSVMFGFLSLFCAPIINFWLVAIMRFLYSNLYLYVIILSCS